MTDASLTGRLRVGRAGVPDEAQWSSAGTRRSAAIPPCRRRMKACILTWPFAVSRTSTQHLTTNGTHPVFFERPSPLAARCYPRYYRAMMRDLPSELATLLAESDPARREFAWDRFVARYSKLLLLISREFGGSHDDAMDRYAAILERLREDDFRRLRAWHADRRSALTTWLGVISRRVCVDELRRRYGRASASDGPEHVALRRERRRLADLITEELVPDIDSPDAHGNTAAAELAVRRAELRAHLDQCLSELAPNDRLLLALRFRDDRSAAEIAPLLGFPSPFHVYRRLSGLATQLRQALRRRGIEDPVP